VTFSSVIPAVDYDFGLMSLADDFLNYANLPPDQAQTLNQSSGIDAIALLQGNDTANDDAGSRIYFGNAGNDTISGNGGDDTIAGGQDADNIRGGDGNDAIFGNKGQDLLYGDSGNDLLFGGQDTDVLVGGEGNDTLIGDRGSDLLAGNAGSDLLVLNTAFLGSTEADAILEFDRAGGDRIGLTGTVTEANLVFTEQNISLEELIANYSSLVPPEYLPLLTPAFVRLAFQQAAGVDVDPNGDGIVTGTLISVNTPGVGLQELSAVFNVAPADLSGAFVSVSF
jgi:RTX calcium-binding nonapeptide repeat (4 copies)